MSGCSCACTPRILHQSFNTFLQATHNGWIQAYAVGGRDPVPQATDLPVVPPLVTLGWNEMTIANGTPSSYRIYRSTQSGRQDFTAPIGTTTSTSFTDTAVAVSTNYFYVVHPVSTQGEYQTTSIDTEIKIMVPPVNMALVHRWMANYEMCSNLLNRPFDRDNFYRCKYSGPINNGGFYDYGQNQFWDVVQVGCNYTPPDGTTAVCNDAINGCLGNSNGSPAANATLYDGQVFYDRVQGYCYLAKGGTWTLPGSLTLDADFNKIFSNRPGLPPAVRITSATALASAQSFTIPGLGAKRLPSGASNLSRLPGLFRSIKQRSLISNPLF